MIPLLSARDLKKVYRSRRGRLQAVSGVSFDIFPGEVLGLVGESGCGKSTVAKMLMRLTEPSSGEITFSGQDLLAIPKRRLPPIRQQIQMVFQDPHAALNPRMSIRDAIAEPLDIHRLAKGREREARILELLSLVGLRPDCLERYPHEFSGGQRQRIGIARALASNPRFLICDEPVSALDLSIQAQVIRLLQRLQQEMALTYLFITHNLDVVRLISNRVGVMYLGQLVEIASTEKLFATPLHPYTRALLSAIPIADPVAERKRSRIVLPGEPPSALAPPSGCRFHTRCPMATKRCRIERPKWIEMGGGHKVACHLYQQEGALVQISPYSPPNAPVGDT
ncbi:MAG: ABC transporter ATP-binding protein [Parachlamydiales bacterium]